jgi:2,3-bisphosphoglycerate-independent phosphoglycerate mutase
VSPDSVEFYDEFEVKKGAYGLLEGAQFMKALLA